MSERSPQPIVRFSLPRQMLCAAAAPVGVGLIAAACAPGPDAARPLLAAGVVVGAAGLFGPLLMRMAGPRPAFEASLLVVLSSMGRLIGATAGALALYLAIRPATIPFWMTFLGACGAGLICETWAGMSAIRGARADGRAGAVQPGLESVKS